MTVPRYVADHAARGDNGALSAFVSTYLVMHLVVALLGALAGLALTPLLHAQLDVPPLLRSQIEPAWRLVVGGWALGLAAGLFQSFLIGLGDVALANVANSSRTVLTLLVAAAILLAGGGLAELLAGLMVASLIGSLLAFALVRARHPEIRISPRLARRATLRSTARPAALFFLMQIAALVVTGTDNVIISVVLGVGLVASYAVAFQLWALALAVLWSGVDALLPFFTKWDVQDQRSRLQYAYLAATRYAFAGAVLAAIVLSVYGASLVRWWVGDALTVPAGVLTVFAAMLLTATPIHIAALLLTGLGRHRSIALGGAAEALLNLAISLALVRPLGVLGVALGTLCSGILTNAWIAPRSAAREMGIAWMTYAREGLRPALLPGLLAGIPAVLIAGRLSPGSPAAGVALAATVAVYLLVFWFGSLDGMARREALGLIGR